MMPQLTIFPVNCGNVLPGCLAQPGSDALCATQKGSGSHNGVPRDTKNWDPKDPRVTFVTRGTTVSCF